MACIPLATPDWHLLAAVLAHIRDIGKRAIVVCPLWQNRSWDPLLASMTEWRFVPPNGVPMFVVAGNAQPTMQPAKLKYRSGFFMVNGLLPHARLQASNIVSSNQEDPDPAA